MPHTKLDVKTNTHNSIDRIRMSVISIVLILKFIIISKSLIKIQLWHNHINKKAEAFIHNVSAFCI